MFMRSARLSMELIGVIEDTYCLARSSVDVRVVAVAKSTLLYVNF